jgi:hypothetical protein
MRRPKPEPVLSLYRLLDPEILADPYPLYQKLREEKPVYWDPYLSAWIVTRYDDVQTVLHRFNADRTPTPEQLENMGMNDFGPVAQVMVKQMLFMDGAAHMRLRSLAAYAFTPGRVAVLRNHIGEIVNQLLDKAAAAGSPLDLVNDFAVPLPAIVTAEMLGVPVEDYEQLKDWSAAFAEMLGNFQHNPGRIHLVREAVEGMTAYFRNAIAENRANPREGLIQAFLAADLNGDHFSEEEVIANVIVTMVGGQETTTNLIGNGMISLLRHRDQLDLLRSDPTLIPSAIEELLRFESPSQQTARIAPADTEMGGMLIRKGQAVIAVMAAANRDPARFPAPDTLDITRKDNRHLAFGYAAHFCFGAPLARIEAQIAFAAFLARFPNLALPPDTKLEWRHNLGLRGLKALPVTV